MKRAAYIYHSCPEALTLWSLKVCIMNEVTTIKNKHIFILYKKSKISKKWWNYLYNFFYNWNSNAVKMTSLGNLGLKTTERIVDFLFYFHCSFYSFTSYKYIYIYTSCFCFV